MKDVLIQLNNSFKLLKNHRLKLTMFISLGLLIKILSALIIPKVTQLLFDSIELKNISGSMYNIIIAMILIAILMLFIAIMNIYGDSMAAELGFSMVRNSFENIYTKPVTDIKNKYTNGEIYQRIQSGSHSSIAIWFGMVDLFSSIISLFLVLLIMSDVNIFILLTYVLIPIVTITYSSISYRIKSNVSKSLQEQESIRSNTLLDFISKSEFIKNFDAVDWMGNKYKYDREILYGTKKKSLILDTYLGIIQDIIDYLFTSTFALLIRIPSITWGAVGITFLLYNNVKQKSSEVYASITSLPNAIIPLKRLIEVLEQKVSFEFQSSNNIILKNVSLKYGDKHVLSNINININNGDKVAFIGGNGSGKTSILKIISNLIQPSTGIISMPYTTNEMRKINIAIGLAAPQLYETSVKDNVDMCKDNINADDIDYYLEQTFVLKHRDKMINELSLGEQQRVGLSRALVKEAPILILDEPTSSLDPKTSINIMTNVLNSEQIVLFATHNLEVAKLADYICYLEAGYIKHIYYKKDYDKLNIDFNDTLHDF